jgi:branched-subunit amino acid transport protein AzlD
MTINDSDSVGGHEPDIWPPAPKDPFPDDSLIAAIVDEIVSTGASSQKTRAILRVREKTGLSLMKCAILINSYCRRHNRVLAKSYVVPAILGAIAVIALIGAIFGFIEANVRLVLVCATTEWLLLILMLIRNRMIK